MNKSKLLKELKELDTLSLIERCAELEKESVEIPASIKKRISEYFRVLKMNEFDKTFGYPVCGVDEAGRGPLIGRVYTAAVILPENCVIEGINDSKKLSEKKREQLFDEIIEKAVCYSINYAEHDVIDEMNIRNATYMSMNNSVNGLSQKPQFVLVDGDAVTNMSTPHECVIGGDAKSQSIAAASILAKVSRDRYILELDEKYPQYDLKSNKGYGTKKHIEAIKEFGITPEHRKTFVKNFVK